MKNLFKKTLACCLVVCMVLTLCISALTVNAENPTGTVVAGTVTVDSGEGTAVIPVEVSAGVAASKVSVKVPANLTITALTLDTADEDVDVTYASAAEPNGKPISLVEVTEFVAPYVDAEGVFSYIIHAPAGEVTTAPVTVEISFTGTFVENAEGILVDVEAEAAPDAEVLFDLTVTDGKIIVKAAHVCEFVGTVTKEATCTEAGVMTYTCTCGEGTYTEEIPVIPHTEETIPAVDATCTTTGLTAGVKCSVCDTVLTAPTEVAALGHDWGEGEVTTAPDCENAGVRTYTCANDPSHTKEEAINALGHTEVDVEAVAPTCTETGLTAGKKCSVCGAFTVPQEQVDALGHAYGTPVDNGDGTHTATCANDAAHKETAEHEYVDGECVCGAVEEVPCAHANVEFVSAKAAASGDPGWIILHCKDCDTDLDPQTVTYTAGYRVSYLTAAYEGEVKLEFSLREDYLNYGTIATDAYAYIIKPMANDEEDKIYVKNLSEAVYAPVLGANCYTWSIGLPAKEYTDVCSVIIYRKGTDGNWYSGKVMETSMAKYCQEVLALDKTEEVEKTLIANALNYGAKAQVYFENYAIDDLATDYLGEYSSYITTNVPDISNTSSIGATPANYNAIAKKLNAVCESKVLMHFAFQIRAGIDYTTMTFEATKDGEDVPTIFVHKSVATDEQILNGEFFSADESGWMAFDYAGLLANDLRKKVTLVAKGPNGEDFSKVYVYSIEDMIQELLAKGIEPEERDMYYAMLNYCDAAIEKFK